MKSWQPAAVKLGVFLGLILALLGIGPLLIAYGVFGERDLAWELQFNRLAQADRAAVGLWIEILRHALLLVATLWVVCGRFAKELMLLLHVTDARTWSLRFWDVRSRRACMITVARLCFLAVAVGLGAERTRLVLDPGEDGRASRLVEWGEGHDAYAGESLTATAKFRSAQACYRWKLPYMLTHDTVIFPLAVIVPLFAIIFTDVRLFSRARWRLAEAIRKEDPGVEPMFVDFRWRWQRQAMRYLNVFAALGVTAAFEVWLGYRTVAVEGRGLATALFGIVGLNFLFFALLWYFYHDAWQKAAGYLAKRRESEKVLREEHHPWSLLKTLFHESLSGYTVVLLLLKPLQKILGLG